MAVASQPHLNGFPRRHSTPCCIATARAHKRRRRRCCRRCFEQRGMGCPSMSFHKSHSVRFQLVLLSREQRSSSLVPLVLPIHQYLHKCPMSSHLRLTTHTRESLQHPDIWYGAPYTRFMPFILPTGPFLLTSPSSLVYSSLPTSRSLQCLQVYLWNPPDPLSAVPFHKSQLLSTPAASDISKRRPR